MSLGSDDSLFILLLFLHWPRFRISPKIGQFNM